MLTPFKKKPMQDVNIFHAKNIKEKNAKINFFYFLRSFGTVNGAHCQDIKTLGSNHAAYQNK